MTATQSFRELTYTIDRRTPTRRGHGTSIRDRGDYQTCRKLITVTASQGRWAMNVPLRVGGQIVVPESEPTEVMTYLSSDESKRRTFTQFRHAINEALTPHEVDHIEFVTKQK